ncbi:uncharacterized protein A1O9_12621 [Exophiala aquamarina CBS 119918]|uniref:Ribonuclease H n=1 Tax=Exophiala aquamarina CBS 119918 TaxID=1182545 RepID=A0A072NUL1_9EURO|nr:uncharacterized protein A1O9_12621 [Exophiala aquamarina CBS 119918]KEF51271.1 hypothetical protein A1O9_12621 [Exophiala aquamarina CBS 119918]
MAQANALSRLDDISRASPGLSSNNAAAGTKRKRVAERKYYAVQQGKTPGIYDSWEECLAQVRGHKGAIFKAFLSLHEAQSFMEGKLLKSSTTLGDQKFYAVQNGRVPGVYTDWTEAQAQIRGVRKPRHKKFNTRAEAEAFVAAGKKPSGWDISQPVTPEEEIRRLIVRNSAPGLQLNGTYTPTDKDGNPYDIGRGPLPPGAEDGFDPNLKLHTDGTIINRTEEEKHRTKIVPKDRDPPGMLRIYTDGSSLRNGQAGARAGVGVYFGPQDPKYDSPSSTSLTSTSTSTSVPTSSFNRHRHRVYYIDWAERTRDLESNGPTPLSPSPLPSKKSKHRNREPEAEGDNQKLTNWRYRNVSEALKGSKQTNQRAELTAISRALDIAPRHRDVTIYTDSKYAISSVTEWYRNWEKNGYLNSSRKPVENKDLVIDIRGKIEEREALKKQTIFVWVKGHANNAGNIEADKLAVQGSLLGRGASEESGDDGNALHGQNGIGAEQDGDDMDDEMKLAFQAMDDAIADDSDDDLK